MSAFPWDTESELEPPPLGDADLPAEILGNPYQRALSEIQSAEPAKDAFKSPQAHEADLPAITGMASALLAAQVNYERQGHDTVMARAKAFESAIWALRQADYLLGHGK